MSSAFSSTSVDSGKYVTGNSEVMNIDLLARDRGCQYGLGSSR